MGKTSILKIALVEKPNILASLLCQGKKPTNFKLPSRVKPTKLQTATWAKTNEKQIACIGKTNKTANLGIIHSLRTVESEA